MEELFEYDGSDDLKSGEVSLQVLDNNQSDRIKCYTLAIRYNF